jgi:hypothetical protein
MEVLMVDPATIIALLAAGAIAKMEGLGGQAVMDAYSGLKRVLVDGYAFVIADLLESHPKDDALRKRAHDELPTEARTDPEVLRKGQELERALSAITADRWENVGVAIEGLCARGDIAIGDIRAGTRGVTIRRVRSEQGDIKLGDVTG